ncbi:deoxyguanosinetriphosphate triphosphohydrolase family protein [Nesterenkonia natronophila]|uniref:DNTP triphosphohydrolase n=1 Tax=Nesterenkonia natronophila TaxID=2174932 RepID=A0A3A4EZU6_9MICC|nr:dNTP triphosphohydrolase [Nesterenkonia natronophila]RJN31156.1 dNTP triphosphohydrolase [Nesterenkonia natronophila]
MTDHADPRLFRDAPETLDEYQRLERWPEFRADLERIRFSPYFSRLSAVTQVISQTGAGMAIHNRLTHSLKVAAVARAIAVSISSAPGPGSATLSDLGGCHPVVVQAAACAHDVGHPPFGHLGEQALDRLARDHFGLSEGFEGNAQSFRILTRLDQYDRDDAGLNLTAAVRSGVLKYPWTRAEGAGLREGPELERGLAPTTQGAGAKKFAVYTLDLHSMRSARQAYPKIRPRQQTVECSVMDVADDIAYSLHDLDDFYRAGLLNQAAIAAEFKAWRTDRARLSRLSTEDLSGSLRMPGRSLEMLWRRLQTKDQWIADQEAFAQAVDRVSQDVVDGLLVAPFDGSRSAERSLATFTASWISHLQKSVEVHADPDVRSGHVNLNTAAWHEVAVLKFLHERFILDRPDLTVYQRGQARLLKRLVLGFDAWLADAQDARRAPRRLVDLVELATEDMFRLRQNDPELLDADDEPRMLRHAQGRGIIDYVASLTDAQATSLDALLTGTSERLWDAGQGL